MPGTSRGGAARAFGGCCVTGSVFYLNGLALCSFLTVACAVPMAFWGLSLHPRAKGNQAFFLMCLYVIVWNLGTGIMLCHRDPVLAEVWCRFTFLGVAFIAPGVYFFTSTVSRRLHRNRRWILAAYLTAAYFAADGLFGDGVIAGMEDHPWGLWPRYGPLGAIFLVFFALLAVASLRNLARFRREVRTKIEKRQASLLVVAFMTAFLGAWDFLPAFGVEVLPVGFVPIVLFVLLLFWSFYRYQFLNPSPESLARKVLETIGDSIIVLDAEGHVRMVNPKVEDLLGYEGREMLHQPFVRFVGEESREEFQRFVQALRVGSRHEASGMIRLKQKEGGTVPTSCTLSAIRGRKGTVQGVILACRDLQEILRSQAIIQEQEERLKETQERYNALFNRSLFGVYIHDLKGQFLDANETTLRILGFQREDLASLNLYHIFPEDDLPKIREQLEAISRTGRVTEFKTYRLRRKDGTFIWIEVEPSLIYRQGRPYAVQGILRDVTTRKREEESLLQHQEHLKRLVEERTAEIRLANEKLQREIADRILYEEKLARLNEELDRRVRERTRELEKANEELKELDRAKDSFLSSVSHELRTPLTSIRSFSEILVSYDELPPETRAEFLRIINTESERLTRLINDVLDLSRIEAGGMVWNDRLISVEEVIHEVLQAQRGLLVDKDLGLEAEIEPGLPPVFADRDRIQQVITNLVGNAVKFSREHGTIRVRAETFGGRRAGEAGQWVKVSVSDEGIGIEEKDFSRIFDKFFQITTDTLKDKPTGTGLGLPICKEIVERYHGNIWVESELGRGSTFFFTLPAARPETDGLPCRDRPGTGPDGPP